MSQAAESFDLDEAALRGVVDRATQADPGAWELLYRRGYSRLFSYARRRLDSDTAADDVVSETMLRALKAIPTFTWQGAGFDAWLYGIARNVVLETYREHGRAQPSAVLPERGEQSEMGPLDLIVQRDQHDQVRAAFGLLSSEDQEILELRVVAGLSAEGVAESTGRTAGAVRMAQSRALQRLRTHFESVDHGD